MATYSKDKQHLPLSAIKEELCKKNIYHKCIQKENIPAYPRPELHVSHVSHGTDLKGLQGIKRDGGFRNPEIQQNPNNPKEPKMIWFSLTVSPDELRDAETRKMTLVHPEGPEVLEGSLPEGGHLQDFATSPAFSSSSRYGSFRFTFSLRDVLDKYSQQFCGGQQPVLRVFHTELYQQAVVYAVLVTNQELFSEYPLLEDTAHCICAFRAGPEPHFVWRPQAMSETHRFGLEVDYDGNLYAQKRVHEFYVWDQVVLALHVGDELLKIEDHELRRNLRFCEMDYPPVRKDIEYQSFEEADAEVKRLWPEHPDDLQKFTQSQFHVTE